MLSFLDSTSHVAQLLLAISFAIALFVTAFSKYGRILFLAIVVMIPFQPITSKYGTINMVVVWLVGASFLLNSFRTRSVRREAPPLVWQFGLLIFVFLMSAALAPTLFWKKYFIHLILIGSNVVLFYMSYWYFRREADLESFFQAMIVSNVLVVLYTAVQLASGYGKFSLGGIQELAFVQNRADQRLSGPFMAVGITAEYLVLQSLLLVHYLVQTGKFRRFGLLLLFTNFAILVGTGNRGGFLISIMALFLFLYNYRRYIGSRGIAMALVVFLVLGSVASLLMVKYTDFNVLYTRLSGTEIEGITPDSRKGWSFVVERITDRPVLGHGPRIVRMEEYERVPRSWPDDFINFYPHSLYLYILYTTGIIGLIAYGIWAVSYWLYLCGLRKRWDDSKFQLARGMPTLGMIIFFLFLIDQFKVEFLRHYLLDYQHYLAALFGMFAALGKIDSASRQTSSV